MICHYIEVPGGDHGSVIGMGMLDVFAFLGKHTTPAARWNGAAGETKA